MSAPENLEQQTPAPPPVESAPTAPTISPAQPAQPVHAVPPIAAVPAPAPAQIGEPVVPTIAPSPVAAPAAPAPVTSAPEPVAPAAAAASVAPAPGARVSIAPEPPDDDPDPPLAAEADEEGEPLLTIEVWQLGIVALGFLVVVAHFVAGTPLPGFSAAAKFRLAIKLVGVLGALLLLLVLRKRQQEG